MRQIILVVIGMLILTSCTTEPIQEAIETQTISIPEWLVGSYNGVHTQNELSVYPDKIAFEFLGMYKEIMPADVLLVQSEDTRFLVHTTDNQLLVFNKTTLDSEINFQCDELNLGWFRSKQ